MARLSSGSWKKTMSSGRFAFLLCLFRPVTWIGLLTVVALGCAGRGDVSGKVTYQNKHLVFGTVLIQGSDGNVNQGNIEEDGSYYVSGVATGEARVAVNSPNPKSISLTYKNPKKKPEPYPDVKGWFAIPKQYEKPSTSALIYSIKRGENNIDIELK
jgi:hypothetical protein